MPRATLSRKNLVLRTFQVVLLLCLAWYLFCLFVPAGSGEVVQDVSFPAGSTVRKLAAEMKSAGVIRSSWHFVLMARVRGKANQLQAGEYSLNNGMTPAAILRKLVAGDVDYRKFSLPEGYSIFQAAELLEQKGYYKKDLFLAKCRDRSLLAQLDIPGMSVEGYLFPATYNVPKSGGEEQLISRMVGQFEKKYAELSAANSSADRLSRRDVVTLASIIEKEAVSPEEKPLISSVFHNRLRTGMPLQSDPTAVYGVRAFTGKVTKKDIKRSSPYNTYLNRGLPPGPIGNPGYESLQAALQPAQTNYLYFVARQDGTHQFSQNLDEHNRAVRKYLRGR